MILIDPTSNWDFSGLAVFTSQLVLYLILETLLPPTPSLHCASVPVSGAGEWEGLSDKIAMEKKTMPYHQLM